MTTSLRSCWLLLAAGLIAGPSIVVTTIAAENPPANPPASVCPPSILWDHSFGGEGYEYFKHAIQLPSGDLALVGSAQSKTGQVPENFGSSDVWLARISTNGALIGQNAFGGRSSDQGLHVASTSDGGFIIAGYSWSEASGNKSSASFGGSDGWLIRTDADGNKLWDRSFGGNRHDSLSAVIPTPDGGFIVAGESISPPSGNKSSPLRGQIGFSDLWVVRVDASGQKLWDKSYGGAESEFFGGFVTVPGGGYLLAGTSLSGTNGNKTTPHYGAADYWVLRLDDAGEILWQQSFGGIDWDSAHSLVSLPDGGCVVAGESGSPTSGHKTSPLRGYNDYWLVRLGSNGELLWDRSYGGNRYNAAYSVQALPDGGFVVGGSSTSPASSNKTSPWQGGMDYWIIRTDAEGAVTWEKSYGGIRDDTCESVVPLQEGGYLLGGNSSSFPRGEKTAPILGVQDFWMIRLGPETPGDCDSDGVADSLDRCPGTPVNDIVNGDGCGLAQGCPCNGSWSSLSDYVACVESTSSRFVADGLLTEAQRQEILTQAATAECPPRPYSILLFGLTNSVIGEAALGAESGLSVTEIGPSGMDGVSVQTGQADSGVFLSPFADIWGNYDSNWYMRGTAYGANIGGTNRVVSRMVARKPGYETYPVAIDLSPLEPTSVTWQVWSNATLVYEFTQPEAFGEWTIYSASSVGPRGNPFWRMPDGSVGALIEFTESTDGISGINGPNGETPIGNRLFARANAPSNSVDYVSRVDVVLGGGLESFSLVDERLGHFGRVHRMLGPGRFIPSIGRLQLDNPPESDTSVGTLIELNGEDRLDLSFNPIALTNVGQSFLVSINGRWSDHGDFLGSIDLGRETNTLSLTPYLRSSGDLLALRAFRSGVLQGSVNTSNMTYAGRWDMTDSNNLPRIIAAGGRLESTGQVSVLSLTFDRAARFRAEDGTELVGDHWQVWATNTTEAAQSMNALAMLSGKVPSVIITSESSDFRPPPLTIVRTDSGFRLSWPARNQPTILEASAALPGEFTRLEIEPSYVDGAYQIEVPFTADSRFFRLRRAD